MTETPVSTKPERYITFVKEAVKGADGVNQPVGSSRPAAPNTWLDPLRCSRAAGGPRSAFPEGTNTHRASIIGYRPPPPLSSSVH